MKKYFGAKMIEAEPMKLGAYNTYRGWKIPDNEDPNRNGYLVKYKDGYESWSPAEAFAAYRPIDGLTFGLALEALKQGKRVCRPGWNGKGMHIEYSGGMLLGKKDIKEFLLIKTVKGTFNTWVPSISDLFAEDWQIIE